MSPQPIRLRGLSRAMVSRACWLNSLKWRADGPELGGGPANTAPPPLLSSTAAGMATRRRASRRPSVPSIPGGLRFVLYTLSLHFVLYALCSVRQPDTVTLCFASGTVTLCFASYTVTLCFASDTVALCFVCGEPSYRLPFGLIASSASDVVFVPLSIQFTFWSAGSACLQLSPSLSSL